MTPFANKSAFYLIQKSDLVFAIVDLSIGLHCIKKIPTFLLLAECEMLLYGTLTSRGGGATFWHERYAEGELSPVRVRPCMCEHGEYKLYRTDRMAARRIVGG